MLALFNVLRGLIEPKQEGAARGARRVMPRARVCPKPYITCYPKMEISYDQIRVVPRFYYGGQLWTLPQDIEVLCSSTYRLRPNLPSTSQLYLTAVPLVHQDPWMTSRLPCCSQKGITTVQATQITFSDWLKTSNINL